MFQKKTKDERNAKCRTDAAEREQRVLAHYAESQGGKALEEGLMQNAKLRIAFSSQLSTLNSQLSTAFFEMFWSKIWINEKFYLILITEINNKGGLIMAQQEKTRYSDAELAEFKELILKKLEQARHDYEELRSSISRVTGNDTEDTSPTFKVLEEGATTLSKEESERLAAHQSKFIRNLELALVRIEHKTYGICKTTGKLIPRERLLRVPHATETIEAKEARK